MNEGFIHPCQSRHRSNTLRAFLTHPHTNPRKNPLTNPFILYILFLHSNERGWRMNIYVDNKSGRPIYEQIYSQIKAQIISGALAEDEALPSIRNLAKDLRISVITTKRAYDELEREGFIYTVAAKGCFVAPKNVELLREDSLRRIEEHMDAIVQLAASCNLTRAELIEMLSLAMEGEK